jgi:hypothetical protein
MAKQPTKIRKAQLLKAIPGSGGIMSTIAARLDVDWNTARRAIEIYPEAQAAYDAECEGKLDIAESVVIKNVEIAALRQKEQIDRRNAQPKDERPLEISQVDSADAKWLLSKRGKRRGYGDSVEIGGPLGTPLTIKIVKASDATGNSNK